MYGQMKCEYCEKDAIGYPGFGCCQACVCADHADRFVLALRPTERTISGDCVFLWFNKSDWRTHGITGRCYRK